MSRCRFVIDQLLVDGCVIGQELAPASPDRRCVLEDKHWDDPHRFSVADGFVELHGEEDLSWLRKVEAT